MARKEKTLQKPEKKQRLGSSGKGGRMKRKGPRLPNAMQKMLEAVNPDDSPVHSEGEGSEGGSDSNGNYEAFGKDIYEYEEEVAQEESGKNRRFDRVENYEYKLPSGFEDEEIPSDDEDSGNDGGEEEDNERHTRMLQGITGVPSEAFEGKKKSRGTVVSEAYPESEYNPSHDVLDGDGQITIQDLLDPLQGKSGYSQLRKRMQQLERKSAPIQAPLPKMDREKVERKVAYEHSKKEILKWEPLVKSNREAATLYLGKHIDLKFSTVGAIASEFEPRSELEKTIASLVYDEKVMEAHKKDGARILELNKVSVEDEKERRDRIAKMRSLLFRHEMKQKHIKKIKSKTYHRLLKKDRLKAFSAQMEMDPEAAKELARKQEFKRAEERLTLKHKNSSKWAKRILKRGLDAQDEGTRAAISEQLQQHAMLTRKMKSMKENSSSDDSSEEDEDEDSDGSDQDAASKMLENAKEKTLKVLEEEDDAPASGVLSLPFMVRGLKKRKEAAIEEAKLALEEYEKSSKQMEDSREAVNKGLSVSGGRMVFGAVKPQTQGNKSKPERTCDDSDTEDDVEAKEEDDIARQYKEDVQIDVGNGSVSYDEDSYTQNHSVFKTFDSIVENPGAKTTYEVSIFASDSWRKMKDAKNDVKEVEPRSKKRKEVAESSAPKKDLKELSEESDTESEGQMVDGILSAGPTRSYELPSQAELVSQAFAGDDVEEDFRKSKEEILNEENPEPEKPVLLPGWGQWTDIQKKRGVPSWMLKEHSDAKKKREEALKKRKDAKLKHVIISEKKDRKAEKLQTKTLPFPFTSKEVFERSIRMPIGPEYNPATAMSALNRPEVVKKPGVIIKPIQFKEVNPHEKGDDNRRSEQKGGGNRKKAGAQAGKRKASEMRS